MSRFENTVKIKDLPLTEDWGRCGNSPDGYDCQNRARKHITIRNIGFSLCNSCTEAMPKTPDEALKWHRVNHQIRDKRREIERYNKEIVQLQIEIGQLKG